MMQFNIKSFIYSLLKMNILLPLKFNDARKSRLIDWIIPKTTWRNKKVDMQLDFYASLKIFSMDPLRRNFLINVWDVLVSFLFML